MCRLSGSEDHEITLIKRANAVDMQSVGKCHYATVYKIKAGVSIQCHDFAGAGNVHSV